MKVWRIEHKDSGLGPWYHPTGIRGIDAFQKTLSDDNFTRLNPGNHNLPYKDGTDLACAYQAGELAHWSYGFKTLTMVYRWFALAKGRKAMAKVGFVLHQYEITTQHVLRGNTQLAFDKQRATLIQERALT